MYIGIALNAFQQVIRLVKETLEIIAEVPQRLWRFELLCR